MRPNLHIQLQDITLALVPNFQPLMDLSLDMSKIQLSTFLRDLFFLFLLLLISLVTQKGEGGKKKPTFLLIFKINQFLRSLESTFAAALDHTAFFPISLDLFLQ